MRANDVRVLWLLGSFIFLTFVLAYAELSGRWWVSLAFFWAINRWLLVFFFRRRVLPVVRFGWDFVLRLCGDLLSLFFEDDGDGDGAVPVEPTEGEDMHAGEQACAQTQVTAYSEAVLPGHSIFEVPGMPLQSSPRFGPDALSRVSAPAYAAPQNFAMGGPFGPNSEAMACRRCHPQICRYRWLLVAAMRLHLLLIRML